jgi:hypothetical protein
MVCNKKFQTFTPINTENNPIIVCDEHKLAFENNLVLFLEVSKFANPFKDMDSMLEKVEEANSKLAEFSNYTGRFKFLSFEVLSEIEYDLFSTLSEAFLKNPKPTIVFCAEEEFNILIQHFN